MPSQQGLLAQEDTRQPRGLVQDWQHISIARGGPLRPGILSGLTIHLDQSVQVLKSRLTVFLFTGRTPTGSIDYSRFVRSYSGNRSPQLTHFDLNGATQEHNQVSTCGLVPMKPSSSIWPS